MSFVLSLILANSLTASVNIRTLNYFLPVDHLSLPCYMPIEIKAAYNSYSGDKSIFGEKWTFNHNIRVKKGSNKFEVLEGDGFLNPYYREKNLEEAKKTTIDELIVAQKKKDSQSGGLKAATVYEEYRQRLDKDQSFLDDEQRKNLSPKPLSAGTYYSYARGPSTLELKADGTYLRSFQNGSLEYFDKEGRITKSADRNGNSISYSYDGDRLVRINDMCGRYVNFAYKSDQGLKDLVDAIRDSTGREIKYDFYPSRRLKSYVNPKKVKTEYVYDKDGNMISLASGGDRTEFSYNERYEVVKQTGPGKQMTTYKRSFVANNKSHSITEVGRYESGKLTSRELHEFKIKELETVTKYDAAGKETKKEIRKISPETGYPVSILDGKGMGDLFEYDSQSGNLLKRTAVPGGDSMAFSYDKKCNQVQTMTMTTPGVGSSITVFTFDPKCNLKEAVESSNDNGTPKKKMWITLDYNAQGKISFMRNKTASKDIAFTYWKYGKPESITLKDSGTLLVKYGQYGDIEKVETFPHGKGKEKYKTMPKIQYQTAILSEVRGSLDEMLNFLRPAGLNIGL